MTQAKGRKRSTTQTSRTNTLQLGIHLLTGGAQMPTFGTKEAACFDLYADLSGETIKVYRGDNSKDDRRIRSIKTQDIEKCVIIHPHERALIPLGLIMDIPRGYSVRIHPRSGLAVKEGLGFANHEGVIDSDYVEPCFVPVINLSDRNIVIQHGQRIAQGELVEQLKYDISAVDKPGQKTNRLGGFGSTGK